jgi:hypothetical protein
MILKFVFLSINSTFHGTVGLKIQETVKIHSPEDTRFPPRANPLYLSNLDDKMTVDKNASDGNLSEAIQQNFQNLLAAPVNKTIYIHSFSREMGKLCFYEMLRTKVTEVGSYVSIKFRRLWSIVLIFGLAVGLGLPLLIFTALFVLDLKMQC